MEKQKPEKPQTGRVNYVWVLAGGYLIYLAAKLLGGAAQAPNPAVSVGAGVLFLVSGAWMLWREWKAYRYGLAHKDDPETWSDQEAEQSPREDET
ncbi:hypothetical protein [Dysosmobacter sp.]